MKVFYLNQKIGSIELVDNKIVVEGEEVQILTKELQQFHENLSPEELMNLFALRLNSYYHVVD